jgi:hypothetical protein
MAQISDQVGIQGILPETRLPDDYRHVQANPEQFGGLIARGIEQEAAGKRQLGQGEAELGRGESQLGQTFGKVAANDAFNQVEQQVTNLLHGDPNKKDPVTGAADGGYMGLQGRAALMARPGVVQKLNELISNARDGMTTLDQQLEFDTITRHAQAQWNASIGAHADAGQKDWYNDVYTQNVKQATDGIARNPGNTPAETIARNHNTADLVHSLVNIAVLKGAKTLPDGTPDPDDPQVKAAMEEGQKRATVSWLQSLAVKEPAKAQEIMDKPEVTRALGDAKPVLAEHLRARADQQNAAGLAADLWTSHGSKFVYANPDLPIYKDVTWNIPGGFSPEGLFRTAIMESSGNPNAGAEPGSRNPAHVGLTQFSTPTWQTYGKGSRTDPQANLEAAQRYAVANAQVLKANGIEPNDALLYLAHQQDGQKVVRALQNPNAPAWQIFGQQAVLRNQGNLKQTAGQFVGMWTQRFNGTAPDWHPLSAMDDRDVPTLKQVLYQDLEQRPVSPQVREMARHMLDGFFRVREVAEGEDARAKKQAALNASDELIQSAVGNPDNSAVLAKVMLDPRLNGDPQLRIWTEQAIRNHSGSDRANASLENGPGYWPAFSRMLLPNDAPQRIADMREVLHMQADGLVTQKGAAALKGVLADLQGHGSNSPELTGALHSVIAGYKQRLSWEGDTDFSGHPKRDSKGEEVFNKQFVPQVMKQFSALPNEKEKWDFIRNTKAFDEFADNLRPRGQMEMERLMADTAPGSDTQQTPIPVAPRGIEQKRWEEVAGQPPAMPNGMVATHRQYGAALMILLNDPSPKTKERFNKTFGAEGATADDVLARLRGGSNAGRQRPVTVAPPTAAEPPPVPINLNDRLLEGPQSLQ